MAASGATGGGSQGDGRRNPADTAAGRLLRTSTSIADLQRILAATTGEAADGDAGTPWHAALDEMDRARLIAAVRQRGTDATLDVAMAADLVAAVMPSGLAAIAADERSRRRLMERIAESLLEDPASARRIQQLFEAIKAAARVAGSDQLRGPS
jgi:hypothetical protein